MVSVCALQQVEDDSFFLLRWARFDFDAESFSFEVIEVRRQCQDCVLVGWELECGGVVVCACEAVLCGGFSAHAAHCGDDVVDVRCGFVGGVCFAHSVLGLSEELFVDFAGLEMVSEYASEVGCEFFCRHQFVFGEVDLAESFSEFGGDA